MTTENVRSERERLVKELSFKFMCGCGCNRLDESMEIDSLVDWVIEDRRRIVAPLVKLPKSPLNYANLFDLSVARGEAISETIKLAGVTP